MTDQDLEQRLRAWYRADIGEYETAPRQLKADLAMLTQTAASARRPVTAGWEFPSMNRFVPLALATTAVVVVLLIGISLLVRPPNVGPSPVPGPTHSATFEPNATPEASVHATAVWSATRNMLEARADFTATRLLDGRVLVVGGDRGYTATPRALASAELYDPASGTWTATGRLITGRYRHSATLLPDGRVLVAGGNVDDSASLGSRCCLASAEVYDPASGTWTATGSMISSRVAHSATLLLDGRVLVAGGDSNSGPGTTLAELYDPRSGSWTSTGAMELAQYAQTALLLDNGDVLVVGRGSVEDYDPTTGTWSRLDCCNAEIPSFGLDPSATVLADGRVLIAGGTGYDFSRDFGSRTVLSASSVVYDPSNGSWAATGSLTTGRYRHTATLLPDGRVLVAGGISLDPPGVMTSAELYDPSTGTWTAAASMGEVRYGQNGVRLLDGTVLEVGGYGPDLLIDAATSAYIAPALASAELYDPGGGN